MKRALLVGINRYPLVAGCELAGCVNDALALQAVLSNGYGFDQTLTLLDGEAQRFAVLDGLAWLFAGAQAGDELVFTFSGHGTQVRDWDGDEPDRLDEALCCADAAPAGNAGLLIDDDIYAAFKALPLGAFLSVISDSCHSGSVAREMPRRPRRIIRKDAAKKWHGGPARKMFTALDRPQRHVLLSGCRDEETAADACFAGQAQGALTYAILQAIQSAPPGVSWEQLHQACTAFMDRENFAQHPQLSGLAELLRRPAFGGRD